VKFIVDCNVGRLARWLRIAGFDTLFEKDIDDGRLVRLALADDRVLLTRDTGILDRRVAVSGRLKVLLIEYDDVKLQLGQVFSALDIADEMKPFTVCPNCNGSLEPRDKEDVKEIVPPYVFKTKDQFMQCPDCVRVYWRGTHWQRMARELENLAGRT